VNSINWARIVAQIVYYMWAAAACSARRTGTSPSLVPTGNFGNVFAGYCANQHGPSRR
jgi:threonine synthase